MKTKANEKCYFCEIELRDRIVFNNKSSQAFILMPCPASSHIECYIKECFQREFKNLAS